VEKTLKIPCVLMRGGTSRGLVFRREHLPAERDLWDPIFLSAIGSPDVRQLDGVGAGDSHTSKVAVVNPAKEAGADLDYWFGEVAITEPRVDYAGNSGNIISALGLYAVEEGLVKAVTPETLVRVRNLNTQKIIELSVPVRDGAAEEDGDFAIDGVPGTGPRIDMVMRDPGGSLTGKLLPTGKPTDTLDVPGLGRVECSLVDAGNPAVFIHGSAVGVDPTHSVGSVNGDEALLARLQQVRSAASAAMGLVKRAEDAWAHSPMVPFLVMVWPPSAYPRFDDTKRQVIAADTDICARVISLGKLHKSINVTVSTALTAATLVPGTLPHAIAGKAAATGQLRTGHPSGVVHTWGKLEQQNGAPHIPFVRMGRTARRIMQGEILVQPHKLRHLRGLMAAPLPNP
jgi:methylitaconate Delta-isomerase